MDRWFCEHSTLSNGVESAKKRVKYVLCLTVEKGRCLHRGRIRNGKKINKMALCKFYYCSSTFNIAGECHGRVSFDFVAEI